MKNLLFLLFTIFLISTNVLAQADLVVTTASFEPNLINKGELITVRATVVNTGNSTATPNYLFIYFSEDTFLEPEEIVSRVSIKELAPNESQNIEFIYPISTSLNEGEYIVGYIIDPYNEVVESNEENAFCASDGDNCLILNISNYVVNTQKFHHPIIFVHGLAGNNQTWDEFSEEAESYYGWSYGGQLDYCLNPDGNQATSDGFINSYVNTSSLNTADYYTVNFDVGINGEQYVSDDGILLNDSHSNQSAIVKQGWAVRDVIEKVLEASGSDEVILVGHSMGGLSSREYLQNSYNWQPDGEHHMAKLLTIATPNGGSNLGTFGLLDWIAEIDANSEATRDLRYNSLFYEGQFLDGGFEDSFSIYDNDDVNCNGSVGDLILGLNQKTSPTDINYSCIVGLDDIVVDQYRADLNNYLFAEIPFDQQHADKFDVISSGNGHENIHKENHSTIIQGLDEPFNYDLTYEISVNSSNFCFSTEQSPNNPYNTVDWDDFSFEVVESGLLEVVLSNIPVHVLNVFLYDDNLNLVAQINSEGRSNLTLNEEIEPGNYILEFGSIPSANSWRFPFYYSLSLTPHIPLVSGFSSQTQEGCAPLTVNFINEAEGDITSYSWSFPGGTPSSSSSPNPSITYDQAGDYLVSLAVSNAGETDNYIQSSFISVTSSPSVDFNYEILNNNFIQFYNLTEFDGVTPEYFWDFGDNESSSQTTPLHEYDSDETYSVSLTASNSCGSTEVIQTINIGELAILERNQHSELTIFPIPANELINIRLSGEKLGLYTMKILNGLGQTLRAGQVNKTAQILDLEINTSNLSSGAYILTIESEKERFNEKIIIE